MNLQNFKFFKIKTLLMMSLFTLFGFWGSLSLSVEGTSPTLSPPAPKSFEGGSRSFSNPFVPSSPGAKAPPVFEDDELDFESEEDFEDFPSSGGGGSPSGSGGGGQASGTNSTAGGISMGGTTAGGVVSKAEPSLIQINNETGEGSKEVVTDFNFPDADILDIAKTLGKLTGKNFILDKDVKGRITIISNSPITVGDAWRAFLTALDMNGFAIIPSGKYIRIARQRDARDKQLKTYIGEFSPDTDALITRLFPLKYLSAEEVARNFRSFMPANSRIIPYEQTNTVIVTDTGSNIQKLGKLLEMLDVEGYDAGIEVIPVKFASAIELSKLIDTLIPGTGSVGQGGSRFAGPGGRFTARRTKEGGIINTIIADERTNTLIVHANNRGADQVRSLVAKLDQKLPSAPGGGKVHVVYLQFAEAEQIANTLNNLSSQAGSRATGAGGTGVNPAQTSLFEGAIKVSPDKATNSLVITASPADFATVQRVINRLDIPRDQVYAEIIIMEITLGRDFNFSSNMNFLTPRGAVGFTPNTDLLDFLNNPVGQKGAVFSFFNDKKTKVNIGSQTVEVPTLASLIKAIQTKSNANILATPQILALDNSEANFETAERIPVLTTTAVQGAVAQSTTKENVSLSIKIKPQINKLANFVKLSIETKLEDISGRELPAQVQNLALATIQRNAKTEIVCADGDTIVMGGLIRDTSSEQISKIPILGDIPLLGWLFRSKKTQQAKTNMLLFITPHIVRQYDKVRAILDKKLKERDEFLESSTGGDDPLRKYRDNIIKGLPDMEEIMAKKVEKVYTIDEEEEPAATVVEDPMNWKPGQPPSKSTPVPTPTTQVPTPGPTTGAAPLPVTPQPPALAPTTPPLTPTIPTLPAAPPPEGAPVPLPQPTAPGTGAPPS